MGFQELPKSRIPPGRGRLDSRVAQLHIGSGEVASNQVRSPGGGSRSRLTSHTQQHGDCECRIRGGVAADPRDPPQNGAVTFRIHRCRNHLFGWMILTVLERFRLKGRAESASEPSLAIGLSRCPHYAEGLTGRGCDWRSSDRSSRASWGSTLFLKAQTSRL